MKFHVTIEGGHEADIEIIQTGNSFSGSITHSELGDGQITDGNQSGDSLVGKVQIGGHNAGFTATLSPGIIAGRISVGWLHWNFSGTAI
jgi:hypothetical protein